MSKILQEKRKEFTNDYEKGKLDETDLQLLDNKISQYLDIAELGMPLHIENKYILNFLSTTIDRLIFTYNNILPIFNIDIANVLMRTSKYTNVNMNIKKSLKNHGTFMRKFMEYFGQMPTKVPPTQYSIIFYRSRRRYYYHFGRGGFFAAFLFKRHIRKICDDILSTFYFYLQYEKDPKKVEMTHKIVEDLSRNRDLLLGKRKQEQPKKITLVKDILPIIVAVATPSFLTSYIVPITVQIAESFKAQPQDVFMVIFILIQVIYIIALFFYSQYVLRGIDWYKKMIIISQVEIKESYIYDYLVPIQRFIIDHGFPSLKGSYDEYKFGYR
jgi:hypothetical protein